MKKKLTIILQPIVVLGHPLGNKWDINYNSNIKATEYEFDDRLFTLAPIGIAPGNSGGAVLTTEYEFLGLVQQIDPVKAVCVVNYLDLPSYHPTP